MAASPGGTGGRRVAEEQAALRRLAVLVSRAAAPGEVFTAATEEAGRLLGVGHAVMSRYDADGAVQVVASWSGAGAAIPVGTRAHLGGRNVHTLVFETGRAVRLDDYADASGAAADVVRELGLGTVAGAPISVEGRLWGVMAVAATQWRPLPADTEGRLAGFTELAATAIASAQARAELRGFAQEQAALRRVAVLVARAAPPEEVFAAVAAEAGRLLSSEATILSRYDPDDAATIVGAFTGSAGAVLPPVGTRLSLGGRDLHTLVFQTGRPAQMNDYGDASDEAADIARKAGVRSAAGVPITVEGRVWGVIGISARHELPADAERRLAGFTELVATAIGNAQAQAALTASRARIVAAADAARRRIERDLHDGAQQRLVSLALRLREAQAAVPPGAGDLAELLEGAVAGVTGVLQELGDIAHGLHPAVLSTAGLRPALRALARRSAVPVSLDVRVAGRLPEPAEIAAYYAVSEALTNTAKHAHASAVEVEVADDAGVLRVRVGDDGRGGAAPGNGSGLIGLRDRVEAAGGRLALHSPPGAGTVLDITLPLGGPGR